jgi:hypothetical protein
MTLTVWKMAHSVKTSIVYLLDNASRRNLSAMIGAIVQSIWQDKTLTMSILLALVFFSVVSYTRSPWRKLPPGPQRLPIIGNTLQLTDKNWLLSRDCKERFGKSLVHPSDGMPSYMSLRKLQEKSCISMPLDSPPSS